MQKYWIFAVNTYLPEYAQREGNMGTARSLLRLLEVNLFDFCDVFG